MRAIVGALLLAACGHPPEPAPATTAGSAQPPRPIDARALDAAPDAAAPDATVRAAAPDAAPADASAPDAAVAELRSCPKTYAALASAPGDCALGDAGNLACRYPSGHCECVIQQPCAGWAGAYEEARKHPRAVWACTPRVRADGCPGDTPKQGSRCTKAGQQCMFGSCGGVVMVCRGGTWAVDHVVGGPP